MKFVKVEQIYNVTTKAEIEENFKKVVQRIPLWGSFSYLIP